LAVCVAACGSSDDAAANATRVSKLPAKPKQVPHLGEFPVEDMVAAASATKSGVPVQLKFELAQRPEVGQPLDVVIAVIPGPNLERVSAKFEAGEGLELVGGSNVPDVQKPGEGVAIRHTVTVVPKRDGIFSLTAVVSADSANQSATRVYSLPVIAGEGLTELAAKSEVGEGQAAAARMTDVKTR
jgi:hypothetical protein